MKKRLINEVYFLEHVRTCFKTNETIDGSAKALGIYTSHKLAEKAIKRYKKRIGFKEYPNGFTIDRYVLNEDHWIEGFSVACVYVRVLGKKNKQYVKVLSIICGKGTYQLDEPLGKNKNLEFKIDDIVKCKTISMDGEDILIAYKKV